MIQPVSSPAVIPLANAIAATRTLLVMTMEATAGESARSNPKFESCSALVTGDRCIPGRGAATRPVRDERGQDRHDRREDERGPRAPPPARKSAHDEVDEAVPSGARG